MEKTLIKRLYLALLSMLAPIICILIYFSIYEKDYLHLCLYIFIYLIYFICFLFNIKNLRKIDIVIFVFNVLLLFILAILSFVNIYSLTTGFFGVGMILTVILNLSVIPFVGFSIFLAIAILAVAYVIIYFMNMYSVYRIMSEIVLNK